MKNKKYVVKKKYIHIYFFTFYLIRLLILKLRMVLNDKTVKNFLFGVQ